MAYTPPDNAAVDFELLSYTPPDSPDVDFIRNDGGTLVSGVGHQTSRAFAHVVASDLDFTLSSYTPPDNNSVDFSYIEGVLGKGYQTSYHVAEVAQVQVVQGYGYQTSYSIAPYESIVVLTPGWDDVFEYIELTIDCDLIDEDLYNFPIRIAVNNTSGTSDTDIAWALFRRLQTNSLKFILRDICGEICYVEVEDWVYADNWAELHARVLHIPSGRDTILRLYFDQHKDDNDSYVGDLNSVPGQSVWNGYAQVYHLNKDYSSNPVVEGSTGFYDLVAGKFYGDEVLGKPDRIKDIIGYSQLFEGDEYDYGDVIGGTGASFKGASVFTVEVLFRMKNPIDWTGYIWASGDYNQPEMQLYGGIYCRLDTTEGYSELQFGNGFLYVDTLHYAAVTFGSGVGKGYLDGILRDTESPGGVLRSDEYIGNETKIGSDGHSFYHSFNGDIDELRVHLGECRSVAWIKATNYSLKDNLISYSTNVSPDFDVSGSGHQVSYVANLLLDWDTDKMLEVYVDGDQITEDLYDFPIRFRIGQSVGRTGFDNRFIFTYLGTNKLKIAIFDTNSCETCYTEIEDWENGDGWAEFHVVIPYLMAGKDSLILFYFDEAQEDNSGYVGDIGSTPALQVWDANFEGVYHLNDEYSDVAGEVIDSTGSYHLRGGYDSTTTDSVPPERVQLGNEIGYSQYFELGLFPRIGGVGKETYYETDITIELFFYLYTTPASTQYLLGVTGNSRVQPNTYFSVSSSGLISFIAKYIGLSGQLVEGRNHVMFTLGGGDATLYINGSQGSQQTGNTYLDTTESAQWWVLGAFSAFTTIPYNPDCTIDEFRVSGIERSAAWAKATNASLKDSLLTYSIPIKDRHGEGYQTSYHAAEIFANSIIGKGYQTSYYTGGDVTQIQNITCSGYQWSYAVGVVGVKEPQKVPVNGAGYQTSYYTGGDVTQIQNITCSGYQVSYHLGGVVQIQNITASGYQWSYAFIYNYIHVHSLDAVITTDKYDVIVEGPYYEAVDD